MNVAIIDDNDYPTGILDIGIPNVTACDRQGLILRTRWINSSHSLTNVMDQLEFDKHQTNIYLARTNKFSTKLVQDFCQTYHKPFISMRSYGSVTSASFNYEYSVMPDILRVLVSFLKYYHVENAAYIYNNNEATRRIYELIKLMNYDEYFNDFSLNIRATRNQDVYSLLYNIEAHSMNKEQSPKYILLDLETYADYIRMFNKISHMGLTGDLYYYIVLSSFDACLWMKTMNFTGRVIYFDYQERECILDNQQLSNSNENSSLSSKFKHHTSYYRSTISFRSDNDLHKLSNSTQSMSMNSSLTSNLSNETDAKYNMCNNKINRISEYFSYSYFISQLPKSYQLHSRSLFNSLNLIISILHSNIIDCETLCINNEKTKPINSDIADVNIFSIKKSNSNSFKRPVELIGKYSSIHDEYQSCNTNKRKDLPRTPIGSRSKIYYITSVFDEPFLMLRKYPTHNSTHPVPEIDLKKLQGRVFDFHELEGFCLDLAERVCSILNITCKFRIVHDGGFGSKNATSGTWDGMVGEVVSRVADMAIAPLTISQKRMEVVDFSKPFMNLGISIMIRKPDAQKPGVFSFMNPVSMEIWLCFSLAYFAVSVVLFLTSRVVNSGWRRRIVRRPSYRSYSYPKSLNDKRKSEIQSHRQQQGSSESSNSSEIAAAPSPPPKSSTRRRHRYRTRHRMADRSDDEAKEKKQQEEEFKKSDVHLFGISNALFFSFASFMRQSINLVPKSLSGRVAATSWWYFSLIFVSSYTANLVAFLTVEKLVTPIESVEDLAKQEEIKYGSVRNGTTAAFFEKSNVSIFQHMWAVMQRSASEVMVPTNDDGVGKVRNSKGKYAFFIESTKNEYVNERFPCDTMKVGSDLDSKGYGITTRLGSDLSEAINIIVTNLRESGFLDKLKQRWWFERSQCNQLAKDKRFSELSLSSVTGLFYIFLFGIILSCVIAFTEFLITAKAESEQLNIDFREILRIKMIENLVGVTIHAQRQLEFGRDESESNYVNPHGEDEMIQQYTQYQINRQHSDV
ncbi:unnamed protein product [Rotaria socialis]|uniref:Uncharacterized protein n=3 Tax=Rotaria socialis TaxID=392032 RepID=A0A820P8I3_9BILA|nr:unnamed protein product [Rotaria socialis]CAF4400895.1 unnamed protein product [Rotaria socialis]